MFQFSKKRRAVLFHIMEKVTRGLAVYKILEADRILNEASALALTVDFTGAPIDECETMTGTSEVACALAEEFYTLSIAEVQFVVSHVRVTLWPAHFSAMPETRYGRLWQQALQHSDGGGADDAKRD